MNAPDPDKTLVEWAMRDLQCFGAETREEAAVALEMWSPMRKLRERSVDAAAEVTELVLARFSPAEPPSVPGKDWLPAVQADAAVLVAEAVAVLDDCTCDLNLRQVCDTCQGVSADRPLVDVPAPVKELPAAKVGNIHCPLRCGTTTQYEAEMDRHVLGCDGRAS